MTLSVTRKVECDGQVTEDSASVELEEWMGLASPDGGHAELVLLLVNLETNLFLNLPVITPARRPRPS